MYIDTHFLFLSGKGCWEENELAKNDRPILEAILVATHHTTTHKKK